MSSNIVRCQQLAGWPHLLHPLQHGWLGWKQMCVLC
jgi:hypothetical protein